MCNEAYVFDFFSENYAESHAISVDGVAPLHYISVLHLVSKGSYVTRKINFERFRSSPDGN